jgi:hypothetical protein
VTPPESAGGCRVGHPCSCAALPFRDNNLKLAQAVAKPQPWGATKPALILLSLDHGLKVNRIVDSNSD